MTGPAGSIFANFQFTNATIVGLAYESAQLTSAQALFGVGDVTHGTDALENNDTGQIITDVNSGDSIPILSQWTDGAGGADIIRILVVPN